jgi:hypothetical protein
MFGWLFRPTCPCDVAAKDWVEKRLRWLNGEFDDNAFTGLPVVLPTREFFPDPYDGSRGAARTLYQRVCGYMGISPGRVILKFTAEKPPLWLVNASGQGVPTHPAATYEYNGGDELLRLNDAELGDPVGLVGTLAHELAHARLLGEGRVADTVFDNELLTDLTVVFMGLGIFLANGPRNWAGQYGKWPGTDLFKPEYMTPPLFGYALAHLAWHRGEERPPWAKYLHWAARVNFNQGFRYLRKTANSRFKPWELRLGAEPAAERR